MIRHHLSYLSAALVAVTLALANTSPSTGAADAKFSPGQMWSIKAPTPTSAKVVIGRVEPWNQQTAVHVTLIDVPVTSASGEHTLITVDHAPFDETALVKSVDKLLATGVSPSSGFERGYEAWRSDQRAGIFTIGVSEAITALIESVVRQRT